MDVFLNHGGRLREFVFTRCVENRPTLRPTPKQSEMAKILARGLGLGVSLSALSLGFTQVASSSTMSRQSSSSSTGKSRNFLEDYAWPKAWPFKTEDFRHMTALMHSVHFNIHVLSIDKYVELSQCQFPNADFRRMDEGEDSSFYFMPRLVHHIDEGAREALTR